MTIVFEVDVDNPLAICASAVSKNQGSISGTNFASLQTDDPDVAGAANPTATALDIVDLSITKTDGSPTEVPGTPVTYTIEASNAGPSFANLATVADTFPAELVSVTWSCAPTGVGSTCTANGSGDINDSVNIAAGGKVTYTVNATVAPDATGNLVNTATVTKAANQIECTLGNNSATDSDTLTPQVDLAITKTDFLTDINAGSPTSYTIVVTNTPGPSHAVGATVADNFPATLLSPTWSCVASARLELHTIGATTLDEYRKHIEKDAALERRFQPVFVDEPSVEDTISILRGLKERYEVHHGVRITDGAVIAAATLSHRYITDRFLPDKAIDLIDEAASRLRMQIDSKPQALDEIDRQVMQLEIEREALKKEKDEASKQRLAELEEELANLKEQSAELTGALAGRARGHRPGARR